MKILSCELENFISYPKLSFKFDEQGLTLIHGATGAGKSTLCDAIPWVLYGTTAKNGAVDEVLAWNAKGPTTGIVELERYTIFRARGFKQNDLYYRIENGPPTRGKDIPDTQRLINDLLGMDAQAYLAATYYHEFSPTAQFFTTTAKNRRQLCENIVDLSLAKQLTTKIAESKKQLNSEFTKASMKQDFLKNQLSELKSDIDRYEFAEEKFNLEKQQNNNEKIEHFTKHIEEQTTLLQAKTSELKPIEQKIKDCRTAIAALSQDKCTSCGALLENNQKYELEIALTSSLSSQREINYTIRNASINVKSYQQELKRLENTPQDNPFPALIKEKQTLIDSTGEKLYKALDRVEELSEKLADYEVLEESVAEFRKMSIQTAIVNIEQATNTLLETYFDAEIKVSFSAENADKLDVMITKDGNTCAYTQLSKGQRQLLKLCFGVAVMQSVRNYKEQGLNIAMFDEALDGMSDDFKRKSFSLFNSLQDQYASIFIVEHSQDFKSLFTNSYNVTMIDGGSVINGEA